MKFNYYLLMVLCLLSFNGYSQNAKLAGKVTEENGDGLMSANVVIDASKGWAAVTDLDGNYEINLPAGTYTVLLKYIGKEEQKIKVTLTADEKKTLNVVMQEKQQMIDVVVVTGSKYEKKMSEETVSMDVVKGSSLQSQNITSLDGGMNRVPGVTIADGQVNIRGGSGWSYGAGSRVLVLVDDLPLLSADAADAKWSIVPMENVEQVEVIKGAASALYGTGALNGIINVRTAYPVNEPYTKATVYTGIYGPPSKTPKMAWWGSKSPISGGVNLAHRQKFGQNDLVLGMAYDANSGYLDSSDSYAVRGNVKYRYRFKNIPGLNMGINLSAYYSWGKTFFFWNGIRTVNGVNVDSLAYKPYGGTITQYKSYRYTVDPFIDYFDKKGNHFKFNGRFFNSTNTNNTGQGSVPNRYYGEFQYHRKFEFKKFDFNFVAGTVAAYDDVNPPKGATGSLFGKNNSFNYSVYAQTDFKFFKKLSITLGARWEYFKMTHYVEDSTKVYSGTDSSYSRYQRKESVQNSLKDLPYPLFRIGVNYQAAEATFIRASFGQGFRYPTIAERYISTSVGPLYIAANPVLTPEKGYSAEVAIKQGFKISKDWTGYADASFFWNQYDNMMEFTFGRFGNFGSPTGGLGFASQNVGKTRILGTELIFAGQGKIGPVGLQFVAGYNFIDPRSLNWNDSLSLYNYQGIKLTNISGAYNQANLPDSGYTAISYGMTSSTKDNLLKYRNRHTLKLDVTLTWKGIEWNTNLQYSSYMENIDYAFTSPIFKIIGGTAFGGLEQYRNEKAAIKVGKGKGDIVWNMHWAYNFKQGVRVAFLVKNLLNWEYSPRPAYMEAPRNYQIQLSYTFGGVSKKKNTEE